ncbi:MAG: adenylyltransferase/cytidyltransferase family protein [Chloroflexi bacterium]|nr:adenylyltransferase/cytidyltransferase family protein [Chloroflexota bacterium]
MMPLLTLPEAAARREALRASGQKLVLTNGVFDLLHVGHVDYLEQARALGGALFVGVNGDGSARQLKGEGRPFVPAGERARLIASLACVDAAILFDELTADNLLLALRPDVYAKGGDYAAKPLPERATAESTGATITLLPLVPDHSTSALLDRIRKT